MYLHASDKACGVGNFHSAVGSKLIRREMATKALKAGLTPRHGLGPLGFKYTKPQGGPLAVGVLGAGRQGQRLLAAIDPAYITVRSISDLRNSCRDRAIEVLMGVYKDRKWSTGDDVRKDIHVYPGYEELLATAKADGLEAVIIALPSHLHAAATLAALDAGLHVFVEPPIALTVADAKKVAVKAADKKLCLAVGQQRRYNWLYDNALEMVRHDLLDQVHYLRSQWHLARPEKQAEKGETAKKDDNNKASKSAKAPSQAPADIAINWWQDVPAGEAGQKFPGYESPAELINWQLYEKFSGGLLAELGSQLFDTAAAIVAANPHRDPQRPYPLSVTGTGSQILRNAAGDIDDHVHCIFEYAIDGYVEAREVPPKARKKIALQFDFVIGNEFDGYGETVLGRKGSLVLEDERKAMLFHTSDVDKPLRVTLKKNAKPSDPPVIEVPKDGKGDEESEAFGRLVLVGADQGFAAELQHWAFCCKPAGDSKADYDLKPRCDATAGLYATVLTVAASKAVRLEKRVDFEKEWFDVKSEKTPDSL